MEGGVSVQSAKLEGISVALAILFAWVFFFIFHKHILELGRIYTPSHSLSGGI